MKKKFTAKSLFIYGDPIPSLITNMRIFCL